MQNFCEVGHENLLCNLHKFWIKTRRFVVQFSQKSTLWCFSSVFWNLHLPQNNLFSCISAFADLIPALTFNKSLIPLPSLENDHFNSPLWISPFPAVFYLFHIASSPSGSIYTHISAMYQLISVISSDVPDSPGSFSSMYLRCICSSFRNFPDAHSHL